VTYQVVVPKTVRKQIDALPADMFDRAEEVIRDLAEDPRPDGVVKMKGSDQTYRIRIGNYRIVYEIYDKRLVVLILQCKHRREVYRRR
jgi:mRNA interferase RelE/StbE